MACQVLKQTSAETAELMTVIERSQEEAEGIRFLVEAVPIFAHRPASGLCDPSSGGQGGGSCLTAGRAKRNMFKAILSGTDARQRRHAP